MTTIKISVSTANYYDRPFEEALEIIALAGFQFVELDLFWEHKLWAMAQHLRGYDPRDVVRLIHQAGLKVASIHDGGGVLDQPGSIRGFINPQIDAYLEQLGYAPDCLVFHTPHIEGALDDAWWLSFAPSVLAALEPYRGICPAVTIENMPSFDGYFVPLTTPEALSAFVRAGDLGVTLDTTHYAQIDIDITRAAQTLFGKVKTVHFSDYQDGKTHVFPGDGASDFPAFFQALDASVLRWITLECAPCHLGEEKSALPSAVLAQRLSEARQRTEQWAGFMLQSL